jgi:hypothetical protein
MNRWLWSAALLACGVAACQSSSSSDNPGGDDASLGPGSTSPDSSINTGPVTASDASSDAAVPCVTKTMPEDPTSFPACSPACNGAHCVPTADVPASITSELAACTGGYCVPDTDIQAGTIVKPAACQSLGSAAGVCLSVCIPQVAQYMSLLPQATCATGELCAPCVNPLTKMSTGACSIGTGPTCENSNPPDATSPPPPVDAALPCPYTGPPIINPTSLPACGSGGAHCLSSSLVPAALASKLATCPTGLCVPDTFIESGGQFIPPTCTSLDGAEGRCLNVAIPEVASEESLLPQDVCQSYERCVPCYSPIDGTSTGACNLSCDPGPTKPAVTFQNCCTPSGASTTQGKCVPTSVIPSAEQSDLDQDECTDSNSLCVPTEMLAANFTPPVCTASGLLGEYTGVCLSNCVDLGFLDELAVSEGTCDDIHQCVPCSNPLTGDPTGAPGCP